MPRGGQRGRKPESGVTEGRPVLCHQNLRLGTQGNLGFWEKLYSPWGIVKCSSGSGVSQGRSGVPPSQDVQKGER